MARDGKGRFINWWKWKRSDPSTWVRPPKKEFEVPLLWTKVTLYYEGKEYRSFHIDAGIVRRGGDAERMKRELWKLIVKEAKKKGWKLDKTYFDKDAIYLNQWELRWGVGYEEDGSEEEWCEAWRT